jgi:hypothetical protein
MLTAAACVLLAFTEPGISAQQTQQKSHMRTKSAMESQSRSAKPRGADSWRGSALPSYSPTGTSAYPWGRGYNLPYPDRPYGDPGKW